MRHLFLLASAGGDLGGSTCATAAVAFTGTDEEKKNTGDLEGCLVFPSSPLPRTPAPPNHFALHK